MAITVIDELSKVASLTLQNANLWEMYDEKQPEIKYRIKSASLPFFGLETIARTTGSKHYSAFIPEGEFSITFLETIDFSTYNYLIKWLNDVYDIDKRVFRNGTNGIRNLIISFQYDAVYSFTTNQALGERKYNKSFKIEKVKIKKLNNMDLDYEKQEPLFITATFIADRVVELPVELPTLGGRAELIS